MGLSETLLLGFIAGVTILLGMPIARLRRPMPSVRVVLNATAVGVLLFLVWDVFSAAWEPIDVALGADPRAHGRLCTGGRVRRVVRRWPRRWPPRPRCVRPLYGSAFDPRTRDVGGTWRDVGRGTRLRRMVCRNLVAGAQARSARSPSALACTTSPKGSPSASPPRATRSAWPPCSSVGFALHNATEGFGIVAPLAGEQDADGRHMRPSWRFLFAMAAIGGGPTFVGTWVGHGFTSEPVAVVFLTVAAGSSSTSSRSCWASPRAEAPDLVAYGLLLGVLGGSATDAIVTGRETDPQPRTGQSAHLTP